MNYSKMTREDVIEDLLSMNPWEPMEYLRSPLEDFADEEWYITQKLKSINHVLKIYGIAHLSFLDEDFSEEKNARIRLHNKWMNWALEWGYKDAADLK